MAQFVLSRDPRGDYRWRLVSRNGQTLAHGYESQEKKADAEAQIAAVRDQAPDAGIDDLTQGSC